MILFLFTVYLFIYFNNIRNLFSSLHIYFNVGRCYIFKTIFTSFFSFLVVIFCSSTLLLALLLMMLLYVMIACRERWRCQVQESSQ